MGEITEKLKSELAALRSEDRAELAYFLLRSLDEGGDTDGERFWSAELARRASEIETGSEEGEPAKKVFEDLLEKYSRGR